MGNTFTVPFSGQHSCFSTSSGGLKKSITAFLSGCDAYNVASFPVIGMGTLQPFDVRDFNVTIIMISISQLCAASVSSVAPLGAAVGLDLPLSYHRRATMNQSKMPADQSQMAWKPYNVKRQVNVVEDQIRGYDEQRRSRTPVPAKSSKASSSKGGRKSKRQVVLAGEKGVATSSGSDPEDPAAILTEYEELLPWTEFKEVVNRGGLKPSSGYRYSQGESADPRVLEALMKAGRLRAQEEKLSMARERIAKKPRKFETLTAGETSVDVEQYYNSDVGREEKMQMDFRKILKKLPLSFSKVLMNSEFDYTSSQAKATEDFIIAMACVLAIDELGIQNSEHGSEPRTVACRSLHIRLRHVCRLMQERFLAITADEVEDGPSTSSSSGDAAAKFADLRDEASQLMQLCLQALQNTLSIVRPPQADIAWGCIYGSALTVSYSYNDLAGHSERIATKVSIAIMTLLQDLRSKLPTNAADHAYDLKTDDWDKVTVQMMLLGDRPTEVLEGVHFNVSAESAEQLLSHIYPKAKTMMAFAASFLYPRLGKSPKELSEGAKTALAVRILRETRQVISGLVEDKATKSSALAIASVSEPHTAAALAMVVGAFDLFPGAKDVIKIYGMMVKERAQSILCLAGFDAGPVVMVDSEVGGCDIGDIDTEMIGDARQEVVPQISSDKRDVASMTRNRQETVARALAIFLFLRIKIVKCVCWLSVMPLPLWNTVPTAR